MLLANDTDSLGKIFSITGASAESAHGGTITLDGNSIDYTPAANYSGADSFTYTISDGVTASTGTVSFNVAAASSAPLVTITIDTPDGLNFTDETSPLVEMGKARLHHGGSATSFTLVDHNDNVSFVVDGSGFTYDGDGDRVTGGTLTSFHEFTRLPS